MKKRLLISIFTALSISVAGMVQPPKDTIVYLFPGQGADARLFKHLKLPPGYDTVNISYPIPHKRESLHAFALRFVKQIDQSSPYILMGVSLGGMICTELSDTLVPLKTILISSAKGIHELPNRYTFAQNVPINRLIPKRITKGSARLLQGIVEPDRKYDKETFKDMLKRKDPFYMQRTVDMIIQWERVTYSPSIIHIHGNTDHTIPIKNVQYDYLVEEGSHMMMITKAREINLLLAEILKQ